jgi:arylsulfatase A-like enzyme
MHPIRRVVVCLAAALVTAAPAAGARRSASPGRAVGPGAPNILLIVTDDQRWDGLGGMPTVQRELVDKGVTFDQMFTTNSLCCPGRASIFTGDFSHTTGVYRNEPPFGAFRSFRDTSTIATWLHDGGYRTALFGKYIDAYQAAANQGYVPPGWDQWEAFVHAGFYDYRLTTNGVLTDHGAAPSDYSTTVLGTDATDYVRSAPTTQPLFLEFAPEAPHAPAIPEPRYAGAFNDLPPWNPPNMNESDMSDKPAYMRALPLMDSQKLAANQLFRQGQYRTLLSVDDQVAALLQAYRDTGRLQNTMVIFTSDNGLSWGEHRWVKKEVPYDESLRVPLVIRYDPVTDGAASADQHLVLNADIAPTVADLAGVTHPATDGSSLLPILRDPRAPWRHDFVLEHMRGANPVPTYCGVRTETWKYVRYSTGEEELYHLTTDPYELQNLAGAPADAGVEAALRVRTAALCNPPPPGLDPSPTSTAAAWVVVAGALGLGLASTRLVRRRVTPPVAVALRP